MTSFRDSGLPSFTVVLRNFVVCSLAPLLVAALVLAIPLESAASPNGIGRFNIVASLASAAVAAVFLILNCVDIAKRVAVWEQVFYDSSLRVFVLWVVVAVPWGAAWFSESRQRLMFSDVNSVLLLIFALAVASGPKPLFSVLGWHPSSNKQKLLLSAAPVAAVVVLGGLWRALGGDDGLAIHRSYSIALAALAASLAALSYSASSRALMALFLIYAFLQPAAYHAAVPLTPGAKESTSGSAVLCCVAVMKPVLTHEICVFAFARGGLTRKGRIFIVAALVYFVWMASVKT